jgi:hypothetical protein
MYINLLKLPFKSFPYLYKWRDYSVISSPRSLLPSNSHKNIITPPGRPRDSFLWIGLRSRDPTISKFQPPNWTGEWRGANSMQHCFVLSQSNGDIKRSVSQKPRKRLKFSVRILYANEWRSVSVSNVRNMHIQ